MKFCHNMNLTLPKQSKRSRSILYHRFRFLGCFGRRKTLSYNRRKTVPFLKFMHPRKHFTKLQTMSKLTAYSYLSQLEVEVFKIFMIPLSLASFPPFSLAASLPGGLASCFSTFPSLLAVSFSDFSSLSIFKRKLLLSKMVISTSIFF